MIAQAGSALDDDLRVRRDAIDRLRRLRWQRRVSTVAVLLVGVGNLVAGIWPRWEPRVVELDQRYPMLFGDGHQPLLVASGVALIGLAWGLHSALRRAWAATMLLALVSVVLHLTRNFASLPTVVAAGLVVWLLATWRAYTVAARPARRHGLLAFFALVGMFAVYAVVGWHRNRGGLPSRSLVGRLDVVARCLLGLSPGVEGTTSGARAYLLSLQTVGGILVAAVAVYALRPVLARRGRRSERALHRFIVANGRTSSAPLAELPDNRIAELAGGDIVLGFKAYAGTAVAVGDPIAVASRDEAAVAIYVDWCATRGLVPTLLAVSAETARRAEELGLRTAKIGEDSIIPLTGFSLAGKDRAKLRQAISRAERDGVTVAPYRAVDRDHATDAALRAISSEWLATKVGPELGFTLGRFDPDRLDEQEVWVARTPQRIVAFVTWCPIATARPRSSISCADHPGRRWARWSC